MKKTEKNITYQRYSHYTAMWILVLYDLPTETARQRRIAADFRKQIMKDGFTMFQFSSYIRHCASSENVAVHEKRVKAILPSTGKVCIMHLTDKQFGNMQIFYGQKEESAPRGGKQLELF